MDTEPCGGGTLTEAADRTPRVARDTITESQVARFTRPWTNAETADFCCFTTRHLQELRKVEAVGFPEPLSGTKLLWWPGEVIAWMGLDLTDVLAMAAAVDAACGVQVAPSTGRARRGVRR